MITAILAITEPTVDAALELFPSNRARQIPGQIPAIEDPTPARRRTSRWTPCWPRWPAPAGAGAAVGRAHRRTALARNPHSADSVRISARQWALLIRVRHGSTPRDLAWDLGRSVFGTTVEAYRMLVRQLLSVAGRRTALPRPAWPSCRSSGPRPSRKGTPACLQRVGCSGRRRLMPAMQEQPSVEDGVRAELQQIRAQVPGVRGSLAATSDGLVFAHDVPDVEPTQIAAISAATWPWPAGPPWPRAAGPSARPWPAAARGTWRSTRRATARSWRSPDQPPQRRDAAVPGARDHRADRGVRRPDRRTGRARPGPPNRRPRQGRPAR